MNMLRKLFDEVDHPSDKWESYFDVYERHLQPFRHVKDINLVEVGVQKGGSLDMWATYFYMAKSITGIDVDPECAKLAYTDKRVNVVIGDQDSPEFWDKFLSENKDINIFIDDGGHFMSQQILTFEKVFPTMPVGSIYICEDCHTSYMSYNGGGLNRSSSFIEYAKSYVDVLHWDWKEQFTTELERKWKLSQGLTSVHFYDSMVVFEKFGKKEMTRVSPKSRNQ